MIFPLLRGLLWFHRAPLTWTLLALNVAMFGWTFPSYKAADEAIETVLDDEDFVSTNGLIMAIQTKSQTRAPAAAFDLIRRSLEGSEDARLVLGHLALRQGPFMSEMKERAKKPELLAAMDGDAVKIFKWSNTMSRLAIIESVHPSYRFGLSYDHVDLWRLLTYQVTHSGFIHLFWNMLFLLLFGTFVEHTRGWLAVLLTTWLGGLGGALAFIGISGLSASPLVGASAAVSALIALSASHGRLKVPFVYWLLPFRGYYGVTWLPAWILVPAFILPDLTGWFSSQPGLTSVAYTAHIGGAVVGFLMGHYFPERAQGIEEMSQGITGIAASMPRFEP